MKTGIMGGTFDPIHTAHLILGESAREEYGLDTVLFMPTGNPPHKTARKGRACSEDRLMMVRLAISGNPHFECSDLEMQRSGFIYTWQTLEILKEERPGDEFFFIIGGDSLKDFSSWRRPDKICENCTLLAAVRDGMSREELDLRISEVRSKYGARIFELHTPNMDISSHMIRNMIGSGRSARYYLPENVREYILEKRIYFPDHPDTQET